MSAESKASKEYSGKVDHITRVMDDHVKNEKREASTRQRDHAQNVLQSKSTSKARLDHILRTQVSVNGKWLQSEPDFQAFLEGKEAALFISGMPGSGKSYLCANTISILEDYCKSHSKGDADHLSIVYHFFNDDDAHTRDSNQALKEIAFQLCEHNTGYLNYLHSNVTASSVAITQLSWQKLFMDFFEKSTNMTLFVVLDGIDEAFPDQLQAFVDSLSQSERLFKSGLRRLRFAFFARPEVGEKLLNAFISMPTIELSRQRIDGDIHKYITAKVARTRVLMKTPEQFRTRATEQILSQTCGMFLWGA